MLIDAVVVAGVVARVVVFVLLVEIFVIFRRAVVFAKFSVVVFRVEAIVAMSVRARPDATRAHVGLAGAIFSLFFLSTFLVHLG